MSPQNWLRGRTIVYQPPVPQPTPAQPKSNFSLFSLPKKILGFMWRFIKGIALALGLIILILFAMGIWSAVKIEKSMTPSIPDSMILSMALDGDLPEANGMTQLLSLIRMDKSPLTLDDVVDSIDRAGKDPRVKFLAVKAMGGGYNLSQLQSIRLAIVRFKATGKKTAIYSESYAGGGYGLGLYYLASAFDEIWMQPVGAVAIGGIDMEAPYFKDAMDKFGVKAQFFQRKEYKNAMENMTSNGMSAASRESTQSLITDMADQLVAPIKASRPKLSGTFDALLNKGYLTDKVALQNGLIDKLDYEDVMMDAIKQKNAGAKFLSIEKYASIAKRKKLEQLTLSHENQGTLVAVIPVEGMIISGSRGNSPFGDKFAGADDIVSAIEDAANDGGVKAIVLRVNSPGGSPTASETIHRAIIWAKTTKKKPVIVSMGSLAASGGYWISAPADKIYAMPSTLTGSIGVVGGKINLQGVWDKLGVKWDGVKYGDNSGMLSMNTPFSESEQVQFESSLDSIYDYFITRIADGRKLTRDKVEQIAKGRAYTGRQALALGLVDKIGGMDVVLDDIAKTNKLASREDLTLLYLPMNRDPMQLLMMMLSQRIGLSPVIEKISTSLVQLSVYGDRQLKSFIIENRNVHKF